MNNLTKWGLSHPSYMNEERLLARIISEQRGMYKLVCDKGIYNGIVSGKMMNTSTERSDFPAIGDWVVIEHTGDSKNTKITDILPRYSILSRQVAGKKSDEQIIATNIDTIFICMSVNHNYNIKRLERYLSIAWDSGAMPVVLLTKSDLCNDIDEKINEIEKIAFGISVYPVSIYNPDSINTLLEKHLDSGKTISFVGSSGVGKSSIINMILGEEAIKVGEIRNDDQGKHTTTNREMYLSSNGTIIIDTPGMRELQLLDNEEGLDRTYQDIVNLSSECKFRDCTHTKEPDCAIKKALNDGRLTEPRYNNYLKLKREIAFFERKQKEKEKMKNKKRKR
jgi:ribosome biogenesis GTPase